MKNISINMHCRRPTFHLCSKFIVLVLSIAMLLPNVAWTFGRSIYGINQPLVSEIVHLGKTISIPEHLGEVIATNQGLQKTVITIQDLHCNYEVQKNIAGIINYLNKKHELKLVGEEGAFDRIDTSPISSFPIKYIREQVSNYFMRQGKITGADYVAAINQDKIILEGIENRDLYQASKQLVRSFLNSETQGLFFDLRDQLNSIKDNHYSRPLWQFDKQRRAYQAGTLKLLAYIIHLKKSANKLHISTEEYRIIDNYLHSQRNNQNQEIQIDKLFQEIDALDLQIRSRMYQQDLEQQVDRLYLNLDIMERLLNISATQEELAFFRNNRPSFKIKNYLQIINTFNKSADYMDMDLYKLDKNLNQVEQFYQLADKRSHVFVENLLSKMDNYGETIAVMINGGFHSAEVLAELKKHQISYISIKPRLTKQDIINPYFELLQGHQTSLDKLLIKNQTIMAIESAWHSSQFRANISIVIWPFIKLFQLGKLQIDKVIVTENVIKKWEKANSNYELSKMTIKQMEQFQENDVIPFWSNLKNNQNDRSVLLIMPNRIATKLNLSINGMVQTMAMENWTFTLVEDYEAATNLMRQLNANTGMIKQLNKQISHGWSIISNWIIKHQSEFLTLLGALALLSTGISTDASQLLNQTLVIIGLIMIIMLSLPGRGGLVLMVATPIMSLIDKPNLSNDQIMFNIGKKQNKVDDPELDRLIDHNRIAKGSDQIMVNNGYSGYTTLSEKMVRFGLDKKIIEIQSGKLKFRIGESITSLQKALQGNNNKIKPVKEHFILPDLSQRDSDAQFIKHRIGYFSSERAYIHYLQNLRFDRLLIRMVALERDTSIRDALAELDLMRFTAMHDGQLADVLMEKILSSIGNNTDEIPIRNQVMVGDILIGQTNEDSPVLFIVTRDESRQLQLVYSPNQLDSNTLEPLTTVEFTTLKSFDVNGQKVMTIKHIRPRNYFLKNTVANLGTTLREVFTHWHDGRRPILGKKKDRGFILSDILKALPYVVMVLPFTLAGSLYTQFGWDGPVITFSIIGMVALLAVAGFKIINKYMAGKPGDAIKLKMSRTKKIGMIAVVLLVGISALWYYQDNVALLWSEMFFMDETITSPVYILFALMPAAAFLMLLVILLLNKNRLKKSKAVPSTTPNKNKWLRLIIPVSLIGVAISFIPKEINSLKNAMFFSKSALDIPFYTMSGLLGLFALVLLISLLIKILKSPTAKQKRLESKLSKIKTWFTWSRMITILTISIGIVAGLAIGFYSNEIVDLIKELIRYISQLRYFSFLNYSDGSVNTITMGSGLLLVNFDWFKPKLIQLRQSFLYKITLRYGIAGTLITTGLLILFLNWSWQDSGRFSVIVTLILVMIINFTRNKLIDSGIISARIPDKHDLDKRIKDYMTHVIKQDSIKYNLNKKTYTFAHIFLPKKKLVLKNIHVNQWGIFTPNYFWNTRMVAKTEMKPAIYDGKLYFLLKPVEFIDDKRELELFKYHRVGDNYFNFIREFIIKSGMEELENPHLGMAIENAYFPALLSLAKTYFNPNARLAKSGRQIDLSTMSFEAVKALSEPIIVSPKSDEEVIDYKIDEMNKTLTAIKEAIEGRDTYQKILQHQNKRIEELSNAMAYYVWEQSHDSRLVGLARGFARLVVIAQSGQVDHQAFYNFIDTFSSKANDNSIYKSDTKNMLNALKIIVDPKDGENNLFYKAYQESSVAITRSSGQAGAIGKLAEWREWDLGQAGLREGLAASGLYIGMLLAALEWIFTNGPPAGLFDIGLFIFGPALIIFGLFIGLHYALGVLQFDGKNFKSSRTIKPEQDKSERVGEAIWASITASYTSLTIPVLIALIITIGVQFNLLTPIELAIIIMSLTLPAIGTSGLWHKHANLKSQQKTRPSNVNNKALEIEPILKLDDLSFFSPGKAREDNAHMVDEFGNKGAKLADMARIELPVPPGFTLPTWLSKLINQDNAIYESIKQTIEVAMEKLEKMSGKQWKTTNGEPLVVSVRAGSSISAPGILKTVGYQGLNKKRVKELAKITDSRFAYYAYARGIKEYATKVLDLDKREFEKIEQNLFMDKDKPDLKLNEVKKLSRKYLNYLKQQDLEYPQDINIQLHESTKAVMASWQSPEMTKYRKTHEIDDIGTGTTIQQMVYGDLDAFKPEPEQISGSGVLYTHHPRTGEKGLWGAFRLGVLGEEVVSGALTADGLDLLERRLPTAYKELEQKIKILEKHYKTSLDIEFTIENGKLHILQVRNADGMLYPMARIRSLLELQARRIKSEKDILSEITFDELSWLEDALLAPSIDRSEAPDYLATGLASAPGIGSGHVVFTKKQAEQRITEKKSFILFIYQTNPWDEKIIASQYCKGVVEGFDNVYSHASALKRMARTLDPVITGLESMIIHEAGEQSYCELYPGGYKLKLGEKVTIDGHEGRVFFGDDIPLVESPVMKRNVDSEEWRLFEKITNLKKLLIYKKRKETDQLDQLISNWIDDPLIIEHQLSFDLSQALRKIRFKRPDLMHLDNTSLIKPLIIVLTSHQDLPPDSFSKITVMNEAQRRRYNNLMSQVLPGGVNVADTIELLTILYQIAPLVLKVMLYKPYQHGTIKDALAAIGTDDPQQLSNLIKLVDIDLANIDLGDELSYSSNNKAILPAAVSHITDEDKRYEVLNNLDGNYLAQFVLQWFAGLTWNSTLYNKFIKDDFHKNFTRILLEWENDPNREQDLALFINRVHDPLLLKYYKSMNKWIDTLPKSLISQYTEPKSGAIGKLAEKYNWDLGQAGWREGLVASSGYFAMLLAMLQWLFTNGPPIGFIDISLFIMGPTLIIFGLFLIAHYIGGVLKYDGKTYRSSLNIDPDQTNSKRFTEAFWASVTATITSVTVPVAVAVLATSGAHFSLFAPVELTLIILVLAVPAILASGYWHEKKNLNQSWQDFLMSYLAPVIPGIEKEKKLNYLTKITDPLTGMKLWDMVLNSDPKLKFNYNISPNLLKYKSVFAQFAQSILTEKVTSEGQIIFVGRAMDLVYDGAEAWTNLDPNFKKYQGRLHLFDYNRIDFEQLDHEQMQAYLIDKLNIKLSDQTKIILVDDVDSDDAPESTLVQIKELLIDLGVQENNIQIRVLTHANQSIPNRNTISFQEAREHSGASISEKTLIFEAMAWISNIYESYRKIVVRNGKIKHEFEFDYNHIRLIHKTVMAQEVQKLISAQHTNETTGTMSWLEALFERFFSITSSTFVKFLAPIFERFPLVIVYVGYGVLTSDWGLNIIGVEWIYYIFTAYSMPNIGLFTSLHFRGSSIISEQKLAARKETAERLAKTNTSMIALLVLLSVLQLATMTPAWTALILLSGWMITHYIQNNFLPSNDESTQSKYNQQEVQFKVSLNRFLYNKGFNNKLIVSSKNTWKIGGRKILTRISKYMTRWFIRFGQNQVNVDNITNQDQKLLMNLFINHYIHDVARLFNMIDNNIDIEFNISAEQNITINGYQVTIPRHYFTNHGRLSQLGKWAITSDFAHIRSREEKKMKRNIEEEMVIVEKLQNIILRDNAMFEYYLNQKLQIMDPDLMVFIKKSIKLELISNPKAVYRALNAILKGLKTDSMAEKRNAVKFRIMLRMLKRMINKHKPFKIRPLINQSA